MRRLIFILIFVLSTSLSLCGQTYLKFNAAYWCFGITNVSVETRLGEKLTLNTDLVYSPWKSIKGNHLEIFEIIPELRFYPKGVYKGVYFGGYAGFHTFNMTKWNYWNNDKHQIGRGVAFGGSVGYVANISPRWNLDVYIGAGWQRSDYRGYKTSTGEKYVGWNGSGEWLPYKLGITFAYRL